METTNNNKSRTRRGSPGIYYTVRTRPCYRIERVSREAVAGGWADGWHVYEDETDTYLNTYATLRDAVNAVEENSRNPGEDES